MTRPIDLLRNVRLPAWLAAPAHPASGLSDIRLQHGRIASIQTAADPIATSAVHGLAAKVTAVPPDHCLDAAGALALPGLVDAHTHLDKTFTRHRTGTQEPGLLGAIAAMMRDRAAWHIDDIRARASQALEWSWLSGVTRLRSHCDWWEAEREPLAWQVLLELAATWQGRISMDCVSLTPLTLYAERDAAQALARRVARRGGPVRLGGFVHSSNWDAAALRHLVECAADMGLDLDLHIDEELNPSAQGLATLTQLIKDTGMQGRVVCGHACALAAQPPAQALHTLDRVAEAGITLISLPATNLLLQDARTGVTPRQRGLTLVQEARQRGIPLLFASDNVEDPFCAGGSFDPLDALATSTLVAQLDQAFDLWSDSVCRADWLDGGAAPLAPGQPADLVLLPAASVHGFPSRIHPRTVIRNGALLSPTPSVPYPGAAS